MLQEKDDALQRLAQAEAAARCFAAERDDAMANLEAAQVELGHALAVFQLAPTPSELAARLSCVALDGADSASLRSLRTALADASAHVNEAIDAAVLLERVAAERVLDEERAQHDCIVCMARPRAAVLMPCRHLVCCASCAAELATCPLCRAAITDYIRALG